jgi:hypothetical protein
MRQRLPAIGGLGKKLWVVDGLIGLPEKLKPASLVQERLLYTTLANELRDGLAINVEPAPDFDRSVKSGSGSQGGGGGDSRNLVAAEVILVVGNHCRAAKGGDHKAVPSASIGFQFLDSSVFEALTEEGRRIPLRKLEGKYHPSAFVGPLSRYVTCGSCNDPEHMANRSTPGFSGMMRNDLAEVYRTVKEFLHYDGYENLMATDPWVGDQGDLGRRHNPHQARQVQDPVGGCQDNGEKAVNKKTET